MMTGAGALVVQTAGERFVVDCKVKPVALVGQVKRTFAPAGVMVSCGVVTGKEMLKIVPLPSLPPPSVEPYSVFPDKLKPAHGQCPSLLVWLGPEAAVK